MRAHFLGPHIFTLGNGLAVLTSIWKEAEAPRPSDKKKTELSGPAEKLESVKDKNVR